MSDIQKYVGDNIGGNKRLLWAFAKDLVDIISIYPNTSNIELSQETIDTYFNEIYFVAETTSHDETKAKNASGKFHNQTIEIKLYKDRQDIRDVITMIGSRKVVCLVHDNNDVIKLVGKPLEGLELNDDFRSGKQTKDPNAYSFEFSGETLGKSLVVSIS